MIVPIWVRIVFKPATSSCCSAVAKSNLIIVFMSCQSWFCTQPCQAPFDWSIKTTILCHASNEDSLLLLLMRSGDGCESFLRCSILAKSCFSSNQVHRGGCVEKLDIIFLCEGPPWGLSVEQLLKGHWLVITSDRVRTEMKPRGWAVIVSAHVVRMCSPILLGKIVLSLMFDAPSRLENYDLGHVFHCCFLNN